MRSRLLLVLAILLAACGGQDEGDPRELVTLWHSYRGAEQEALEDLVAELEASSDSVRVETLMVPTEAYKNRLRSAIPRGNGPDLFIEAHELTGEWSESQLLRPVPESIDLEAFVPSSVDALRFGERVWAVPLAVKSLALFYNRELVPEPPGSLDELLEVGRRLGKRPLVYQAGELYQHAGFLHAFGGMALDRQGRVTLDTEGAASSMSYVRGLVERGDVPTEVDGALVSMLFNQGETPFVFNGPWFLGEIREGLDFGVAPLPLLEPGGEALRPYLTVEALFFAAGSSASEEALLSVAEALAGREGSVRRAVEGRQVPAHRSARQDPGIASDPVLSAFARQADAALPMPNRPEMSFVWDPAGRALRSVLAGDREAGEALERAQREVEAFMEPAGEAASPSPYLFALCLLLVAGLLWAIRTSRRDRVIARARASWPAYLYLAPAFVGMVAVVLLPFLVGASVSLFAHQNGEFTFVGLSNFLRILSSDTYSVFDPMSFWFTLVVTVAWTAANVALHVGIGLGLALLLRDPWMKLKGVYRVLLIVPWAVPNYITALIWKGMFNEQYGAINDLLAVVGIEPVAWFSSFATAFAANLCTNTWLGFPFMMVVTLGALQAIPRDLEEAAEVDGAGPWTRFRHVTLPLLKPALLPAVILGSVWTFNMFNVIYLVSGGEPGGGTEILISEAYKWAFDRQSQYGYAAAYSVLVFGILVLYTALTTRVTGGEVT